MRCFLYLLLFLISVFQPEVSFPQVSINNPNAFYSSNLPIVIINTQGNAIRNDPKIMADMGIIYNGEGIRNFISDTYNNYNGKVLIETRGSSSQGFPKQSYGFFTVNSDGSDLDTSLLGFPKEHNWVLYAPYSDKSLLRNALTFNLSAKMGRYASRTKFCELILNGDYRGVYVLLEKVKRDKNRVNIAKLTPEDTTGDALTGGYIVQIDRSEGAQSGDTSRYYSFPGRTWRPFYLYEYPNVQEMTNSQRNYIRSFIFNFENLMNSSNYKDASDGYPKIIDVNSFVDYFIISEVCKNVDGYRLSHFLYKDRDKNGGRLTAGPIWDCDLAYGNADYYYGFQTSGWQLDNLRDKQIFPGNDQCVIPFWWGKLWDDPDFRLKAARRWNELRQGMLKTENVISVVDSITTLLAESQVRNYDKWAEATKNDYYKYAWGYYIWPNYHRSTSYADEINWLESWILLRLNWISNELSKYTDLNEKPWAPGSFSLEQNYPNPFNHETTIRYSLAREGSISLKIYDQLGQEVITLINGTMKEGLHEVKFNVSGLPSGIYLYRLEAGSYSETKKLIILK